MGKQFCAENNMVSNIFLSCIKWGETLINITGARDVRNIGVPVMKGCWFYWTYTLAFSLAGILWFGIVLGLHQFSLH